MKDKTTGWSFVVFILMIWMFCELGPLVRFANAQSWGGWSNQTTMHGRYGDRYDGHYGQGGGGYYGGQQPYGYPGGYGSPTPVHGGAVYGGGSSFPPPTYSDLASRSASDIAFGIGMVNGKGWNKSAGLSALGGGIGALIGEMIPNRDGQAILHQSIRSREEVIYSQMDQNDWNGEALRRAQVPSRRASGAGVPCHQNRWQASCLW